ncbi:MAG: glycerophosphodiester phosphodiesterase [Streptosporangiales bacterium]|nr:glycerophosphodiester phosphodiesterase [Streptosporangiales bacterium]
MPHVTTIRRRALGATAAATAVAAVFAGALIAVFTGSPGTAVAGDDDDLPIVIAHRGASEFRPEHTLAAYRLAIDMGADFIEPDLVSTKDKVLVARHENEISTTTDVADHPEFATRRTTKTIDGRAVSGWFTEDFTLAELKTLRAKERLPDLRPENTAFDRRFEIPTLAEVIDLARRNNVGVYPETKHPSYFDSIGLSLEEPLLGTLADKGLNRKNSPVIIQSFETANLRELNRRTPVRLAQLIDATGKPFDFVLNDDPRTYDDLVKPAGLDEIARYADGLGVHTARVIPVDSAGRLQDPTPLVRDAHRRDLDVHVWTVRTENANLPGELRDGDPASPVFARATGNAPRWYHLLYRTGIDGLFSDDPGLAVATRDEIF